MELQELKKQILEKSIPRILIFSGEEYKLKDIYIQEIATRFELETKYVEYSSITTPITNSFFQMNYLYVVENDKDAISDSKILEKIGTNNYLIYLTEKLDKRSLLYKEFTDNLIEFNPLADNILLSIISSKFNLSDNNILKLIKYCKNDYGRCLQELDKVKCFQDNPQDNLDTAFSYLDTHNGFSIENSKTVFDFVDAMALRDKEKSLKFYSLLEKFDENKIEIIALLYNRFRGVFICQMIHNPTFESTGLTNYQITQLKRYTNHYTDTELIEILNKLRIVDMKIKSGDFPETISIGYLLTNIL